MKAKTPKKAPQPVQPKPKNIFVGIDNGVSGAVGIVGAVPTVFFPMPVFKARDYTKAEKYSHRVDTRVLRAKLLASIGAHVDSVLVTLERPMVNPGRFQATASALRAWEATLIVLEDLGYDYCVIDSKEWQHELLPPCTHGDDLKPASLEIGLKKFSQYTKELTKQGDADALMIATYAQQLKR